MDKKGEVKFDSEIENIKQRYEKRKNLNRDIPGAPHILPLLNEKRLALKNWLKELQINPAHKKLLEIGCGNGSNLIDLIALGFDPLNLSCNELLPERINSAKKILPGCVSIFPGDALKLNLPAGSFDIVYQSLVFSSILDKEFRYALAEKMWGWVKPGGGILWYDFVYDNPNNQDVAGIPLKEVNELFPGKIIYARKITLAPPLARLVCKVHPSLYNMFNSIPLLRTHILCWIEK